MLTPRFSHNPRNTVSALCKVWKVWKLFFRIPNPSLLGTLGAESDETRRMFAIGATFGRFGSFFSRIEPCSHGILRPVPLCRAGCPSSTRVSNRSACCRFLGRDGSPNRPLRSVAPAVAGLDPPPALEPSAALAARDAAASLRRQPTPLCRRAAVAILFAARRSTLCAARAASARRDFNGSTDTRRRGVWDAICLFRRLVDTLSDAIENR